MPCKHSRRQAHRFYSHAHSSCHQNRRTGNSKCYLSELGKVQLHHAPLVFSCKVIEQMAVRQWCELAVWAIGAFIFPFVAKIGIPFPFAHRLIARLFTCFTIPSFSKHIAPTLEQTLKNGNFFFQTISDNWGRCHIFFEAIIFGGVRYAIFVENRSQPGIFSL